MSAPLAPVVPPRPSRSPRTLNADIPSIPPRPVNRRLDRSVSPGRDSYAPSPLNELPQSGRLSRTTSNDIPSRPPSVTIPSLGEEGIEYEELNAQHGEPAETRNVGSDLKLHAPKPSLPVSSANARVQAVTRTDSSQAAAAGFGKPASPALEDQRSRTLHSKAGDQSRAESSAASSTRQSLQPEEEQGIPEIGQRVPMLAYAGDVQAPSPAPPRSGSASGHRSGRHHQRTRSGRDVPPGSYGLHGHGVHATDKFEKAWYDKHPDELAREEQGQYGPAITERSTWALSSDDLNRLVHSSPDNSNSVGAASPAFVGTPDETIGYIATDEFTRQETQPVVESPLRHSTFPAELQRTRSAMSTTSSDGGNRVIHVDDPYHSVHHPDGFAQAPESVGQDQEEGALEDDQPILAADESRPESAFLHPAVSPRRLSTDYHELERAHSRTPSAPNSRPSSLHGAPTGLSRWSSRGDELEEVHTPLEDVEEYEPLFPDDEKTKKPADRLNHPELLKHGFPSKDIWEDTPDSLQLHASVTTPDLTAQPSTTFETPEAEEKRKLQTEQIDSHQVASHILHSHVQPGSPSRPPRPDLIKHRFPSRDVWEDAPESQQLVTTIEPESAPSRPSIPPRPQQISKPTDGSSEGKKAPVIPDRPKPQVPSRPSRPDATAAPAVNKTKPAVPARPVAGKLAGVKANFLSDLNSRLQLGPQAPKAEKKEEAPAEKAPLADARKGRARGPARRKPATSASVETKLPSIPEIRIMDAWNVWELGVDGHLTVGRTEKNEPQTSVVELEPSTTMAPPIAKNIAGEPADPVPDTHTEEAEAEPESKPEPEVEDVHEPAKLETVAHHEASQTSEKVSPGQSADEQTSEAATDVAVKASESEPVSTSKEDLDNVTDKLSSATDGNKPLDSSVDE